MFLRITTHKHLANGFQLKKLQTELNNLVANTQQTDKRATRQSLVISKMHKPSYVANGQCFLVQTDQQLSFFFFFFSEIIGGDLFVRMSQIV